MAKKELGNVFSLPSHPNILSVTLLLATPSSMQICFFSVGFQLFNPDRIHGFTVLPCSEQGGGGYPRRCQDVTLSSRNCTNQSPWSKYFDALQNLFCSWLHFKMRNNLWFTQEEATACLEMFASMVLQKRAMSFLNSTFVRMGEKCPTSLQYCIFQITTLMVLIGQIIKHNYFINNKVLILM